MEHERHVTAFDLQRVLDLLILHLSTAKILQSAQTHPLAL